MSIISEAERVGTWLSFKKYYDDRIQIPTMQARLGKREARGRNLESDYWDPIFANRARIGRQCWRRRTRRAQPTRAPSPLRLLFINPLHHANLSPPQTKSMHVGIISRVNPFDVHMSSACIEPLEAQQQRNPGGLRPDGCCGEVMTKK